MTSTTPYRDLECGISSECSDSDVPIVRWKVCRTRRRRQSLAKKQTIPILEGSKEKVADKTPPSPNVDTVLVSNVQNQSSDDTRSPPGLELSVTDRWDESRFNLDYPRLINPHPVEYACTAQREEDPGKPDDDDNKNKNKNSTHDLCCFPVAPPDDIDKTIFVHPERPGVKWGGRWGAAKLAKEVQKYERVKEFWLFEHDHGFLAGFDDKHEFVAAVLARELRSPWVVGWLRELIGEEDVGMVLAAVEETGGATVGELDH